MKKKWQNGYQIWNQWIVRMYVVTLVKKFGKVITIYLITVTVIIEIIVKMMVILMNKDNNNK